ncbi:ABC transporter permease [Inquilinus sp.]|jgi:putative ABC transport system permease protein|uniref:ABC transporter permease n=1 Tax=Inquilinus sp. TaxID=1932117 RepID=UPI0037830A11
MSLIAFLGAIEIGLVYALVALGVFLSFRILNFPDLTVDGSFPLGAATTATLIVGGLDPILATLVGAAAGACAGLVTAWLNVRFGILHLLASILTMIALFSVMLRIMGKPNVALINQDTVLNLFTWLSPAIASLGLPARSTLKVVVLAIIVAIAGLALGRFLTSEFGLAMRATGANPRMARAQGISTKLHIYVGMALSNALVALGGAMFAQTAGFADVTTGTGTIVQGLAAVILGETIIRTRSIGLMLLACVIGSILYRIVIALALNTSWLGLEASDLNLVLAVLIGLGLILPKVGNPLKTLFRRSA